VSARVERLPASARRAQPWRNGAGVTFEVVRAPADAPDDDYAWRVSIARLTGTSTFSAFPGIDRTLHMLRGRVDLTIAGAPRRLSPDDGPVEFAGEDPVSCTVLDAQDRGGEALDLNVLRRRTANVHASIELRRAGWNAASLGPGTVLIVAHDPLRLTIDGTEHRLASLDALRIEACSRDAVAIDGDGDARACIVRVQ
jgi:environmental stress-induced protein Ves